MTAINWKNPVNGDWSVATNWSTNAVPTLVDAAINRLGVRCTISSFDLVSSVNFNAAQTALLEDAGSLTMGGALTVDSSLASHNEANTIGSVGVTGGVLAFGNPDALGAGTAALSGGELIATANEILSNALTV
jgi:hypothetical protein